MLVFVFGVIIFILVIITPIGALALSSLMPLDLRDNTGLPRSMRNNNPGNLRPLGPGHSWPGQVGVDNGNYVVFDTMDSGIKCAGINLTSYFQRDGISTASGIAHRWAPAADKNDPDRYAKGISNFTGKDVDETLDLGTDGERILQGIFTNEYVDYANYVSGSRVWAGWQLAKTEKGVIA